MKPKRVKYVVAGVALIAVALLVWRSGPNEPVYQGKAITQWINEAHDVGIFEQTEETKTAMQAFGTNAVPFLLQEFTRPVSRRRDLLFAWVNSRSFFKIHLRTDEERVVVAGRGLMLLETNAAPAMPALSRYLGDPIRADFLLVIFVSQGDAALPYLTAGLASTNAMAITNAAKTLQLMAYLSHASPTGRAAAEALREWQLLNASALNE